MITIADSIIELTNSSENQLLEDIALMLYSKKKLTFGQAAQMAKLNQAQFQFLLGKNQIPINYDVAELEEDMKTIQRMT